MLLQRYHRCTGILQVCRFQWTCREFYASRLSQVSNRSVCLHSLVYMIRRAVYTRAVAISASDEPYGNRHSSPPVRQRAVQRWFLRRRPDFGKQEEGEVTTPKGGAGLTAGAEGAGARAARGQVQGQQLQRRDRCSLDRCSLVSVEGVNFLPPRRNKRF
jgi:hypothetical protein